MAEEKSMENRNDNIENHHETRKAASVSGTGTKTERHKVKGRNAQGKYWAEAQFDFEMRYQ